MIDTELPFRALTTTMTTNTTAHILQSRAPLAEADKKSDFPKPIRTKSFSGYEPASRNAMSELLSSMNPASSAGIQRHESDRDEDFRLLLPEPYQSITLRPLRRTDTPRLQMLMTENITSHLGNEILEKHNEFCSAANYIEKLLEEEWIDVSDNDEKAVSKCHQMSSDLDSTERKLKSHIPSCFVIAENDVLIGMMGIWNIEEDRNLYHSGELMYWLGQPYWNRGIMSAVAKFFLDWCWKTFWWLNRIDAGVYITWNPISQRILSKLGMKYEGRLRKPIFQPKKGYSDIEIWSQMREEWDANRAADE